MLKPAQPFSTEEVLMKERALLSPLRKRHAVELLRAGTIDRIFESYFGRGTVPAINESDEFVPFRMAVDESLIARVVATDGRVLLKPEKVAVEGVSYNLYIHRTSQTNDGYVHKAYLIGNQVDAELADILNAATQLPSIGFRPEDVNLIAGQLDEVAAAVAVHGLTTINQELLMEGASTYKLREPKLP